MIHIKPAWAATVLGLIAAAQHGTTIDGDIRARLIDGAIIDSVATVALVGVFYRDMKSAFRLRSNGTIIEQDDMDIKNAKFLGNVKR